MTFNDLASLAVATLQLKEVSLLVGAIRTADIESGKALGSGGSIGAGGSSAVNPEPRDAPRQVIYPDPRYEPRPVYHPTPRYETGPVLQPEPVLKADGPVMSAEPKVACVGGSGLQPPWKVLPWPATAARAQIIKAIMVRPDSNHVGNLLDCFI